MPFPPPVQQLTTLLTRLPGVGPRTARRLVFFLLNASSEYCQALGNAIASLPQAVRPCQTCGNYTDRKTCAICKDPEREKRQLCVVTSAADLIALEGAGTYRGHYHVLHGLLAPLDGVGPEDLRLGELIERLQQGHWDELILATPLSVEGEATATYVGELAAGLVGKITRIASGVPHGGELELSDPVTLGRAMTGRRALD